MATAHKDVKKHGEDSSPHKAHHNPHAHGAGGTHVKQYENLKTLLKNAKSTNGQDLFAHLQEVFKKLILHYPD